jgi:hypothetical protein
MMPKQCWQKPQMWQRQQRQCKTGNKAQAMLATTPMQWNKSNNANTMWATTSAQQGQSQRNNQRQHNNDDIVRSMLAKTPPCNWDDTHEIILGGEVGNKEPNTQQWHWQCHHGKASSVARAAALLNK